MALKVDKVTLPAYWSSALINGDFSGLENAEERDRVKAVIAEYARDGWTFADCEDEARFTWSYNLYDPGASVSGGEVLEYTILR